MEEKLLVINKRISELENYLDSHNDNGLKGTIVLKYIKCGKAGCKCLQGYKHGPYPHIQFYNESKKLTTLYIKKSMVETYDKKIKDNQKTKMAIKEINMLYKERRRILNGK